MRAHLAGGESLVTYYDILNVKAGSDERAIRAAYLSLMAVYHPDRCAGGESFAHFHASRINEAYSVLIDPERRARYDARLTAGKRFWGYRRRARPKPPPRPRRKSPGIGPRLTASIGAIGQRVTAWADRAASYRRAGHAGLAASATGAKRAASDWSVSARQRLQATGRKAGSWATAARSHAMPAMAHAGPSARELASFVVSPGPLLTLVTALVLLIYLQSPGRQPALSAEAGTSTAPVLATTSAGGAEPATVDDSRAAPGGAARRTAGIVLRSSTSRPGDGGNERPRHALDRRAAAAGVDLAIADRAAASRPDRDPRSVQPARTVAVQPAAPALAVAQPRPAAPSAGGQPGPSTASVEPRREVRADRASRQQTCFATLLGQGARAYDACMRADR